MPFGLQVHMAAAHGSAAVKQQLRAGYEENGIAANKKAQKRGRGRRRSGRQGQNSQGRSRRR